MNRWIGKVAVVTGASSGIGAAVVQDLAKAGVITVGLARRKERIDDIVSKLSRDHRKNLYAIRCDITKESDIVNAFREIEERFGGIDILINNAGVDKHAMLTEPGNTQIVYDVINTNLMGLIFCTREATQSMIRRSVDGHVIHINSVAGHSVPFIPGYRPRHNVYHGSKYAVTAVTETHRQEFIHLGTKIKVSSISPGFVDTDLVDPEIKKLGMPSLKPEDLSNTIMYVLGTPPHVQIHELTIKPAGEMF